MKCSIARCKNPALMLVTFVTTPREETPFCAYHGRDRDRNLRWGDHQVSSVERV